MRIFLLKNTDIKLTSKTKAGVQYDPLDLIRFISKNFIPLNTMMERAGMSEMDIYLRTRDIFLYFKLPYDSEPPPSSRIR